MEGVLTPRPPHLPQWPAKQCGPTASYGHLLTNILHEAPSLSVLGVCRMSRGIRGPGLWACAEVFRVPSTAARPGAAPG